MDSTIQSAYCVGSADWGFNDARADGFGTFLAKLKLYNGFGAVTYSESFNVNIQPEDGGGVQQVNIAGPVDGSTLSTLIPCVARY